MCTYSLKKKEEEEVVVVVVVDMTEEMVVDRTQETDYVDQMLTSRAR